MSPQRILLAALVVITFGYVCFWFVNLHQRRLKGVLEIAIGWVTNFFDTLGIGSFATTTSMYKLWNVDRDEKMPGDVSVRRALPVHGQPIIFVTIVSVDF